MFRDRPIEQEDILDNAGWKTGETLTRVPGIKGRALKAKAIDQQEHDAINIFQIMYGARQDDLGSKPDGERVVISYEPSSRMERRIDRDKSLSVAEKFFKKKRMINLFRAVCEDEGDLSYRKIYDLAGLEAVSNSTKERGGKKILQVIARDMDMILQGC